MDRNYFLSCGHRISATFLLVISAIGNINATFISTALSAPNKELHRNNNPWNLADSSVYSLSGIIETLTIVKSMVNHYGRIDYDHTYVNSSGEIRQKHSQTDRNVDLLLLFLKDAGVGIIVNDWNVKVNSNRQVLVLSEKFKIFYTNLSKWLMALSLLLKFQIN